MSVRRAACSTMMAKKPTSTANQMLAPHWPGEIQTPDENSSRTTMARPAGLKTCLPLIRNRNFDEIAITPATACTHGSSARSNRLSDSPVIRGERRSSGIFVSREQTDWVSRLAARANALAIIRAPKSIIAKLIVKRLASAMIWRWRASDHMDRKRHINTGRFPNWQFIDIDVEW